MGLFGRKKNNTEPVSTLSEDEIQKKLYGEFKTDSSRIAGGGEHESTLDSNTPVLKAKGAGAAHDLFSAPRESSKTVYPDFSTASREIPRVPETVSKPVSLNPVDHPPQPAAVNPANDPYQRYREINAAGRKRTRQGFFGLWSQTASFLNTLFDSNRFLTRQVLYWTGGVLVVFLLFWGVNALNVQREQSMKTQYTSPAKTSVKITLAGSQTPEKTSAAAVSQPPKAAAEGSAVSGSLAPAPAVPATGTSDVSARTASAISKYGGRFVIQVVTYPSEDYASRIVTSLKQAGFNAFAKENVRSTGTTFYLVLIGGFRTAAEAQQQLAKFRAHEMSRPFSDAFIKTIE